MSPRHIYDADGYWVAFIVGNDVFDRAGERLGHLVDGQEIYGVKGDHLGTLTDEGRLVPSGVSGRTFVSEGVQRDF
jgi:hypothetical protein